MRDRSKFVVLSAVLSSLLFSNVDRAYGQCAPGNRCGPNTNYYPDVRPPQQIRPLSRPVLRYNPAMRQAFPQARFSGQGYVFSNRSRAAAYAYQNALRQQGATYGSIDQQLKYSQWAARAAPYALPSGRVPGVSALEQRALQFYAGQAGRGAGAASYDIYGRLVRNPNWLNDFDPRGAQSRFTRRQ